MKINVLTLFPEMFFPVTESVLKKAEERGLLTLNFINIRDFSLDKHKKTDDSPYGGGPGMIMTAQPISDALRSIGPQRGRIIYMSPRGRVLDREKIVSLAGEEEFTILCGHYEGVDQRVIDLWRMEEISIGDYVLTGGELPAMVLIDAVARFVPGVLSGRESVVEESVYSGLLEYPQFTKPREYEGMEVPEVLLSGDHRLVRLWKFEEALRLTKRERPDMFEDFVSGHGVLTKDEQKVLEKILKML